jgi:ribose transport system substrate-binding protein
MTDKRRKPRILSVAMIVFPCVVALAAAGCGSSTKTTGATNSPAASSSPALAEVKRSVEERTNAPTSVGSFSAISKPIPKGKKLLFLECATACGQIGTGVQAAAHALGWTYQRIQLGASPAAIANGWQQAVQAHPDAVIASGNPRVLFEKQLAQLHQAGIPYFGCCTADKLGGGMEASIAGAKDYEARGKLMADWVLAKRGPSSDTILFTVADFPVLNNLVEGFKAEYHAKCPGCKVTVENAQVTDIGTKLPAQVVSAVQRNASANYLVFGFGAMTTGVPAALKAAGLSERVKAISQNPEPANLEAIVHGNVEEAGIPLPESIIGWMAVDAAARHFAKEALPQSAYAIAPTQYLTATNIKDPSQQYVGVTDYQQQFQRLWGLSK